MKRFKQLISAIAAAAVMLGCLCVSAAAESPAGSLTVTIQGNIQGISTAGITLNLYRIGGEDGGTWKLDSAFAETGYMEAWTEQSGAKMRTALRNIRGIVNTSGMNPSASAKSNANGVIVFESLPRGIYFGIATGVPKEMTVQNFVAHIPEAGSGKMDAQAVLKNNVTVPKEKNPYKVTIRYIYEDGTPAHQTYEGTYWPDDIYDVYSPVIPDYTASILRVNGVMPERDLQFTVIYIRNDDSIVIVNIPEYETPLGLGELQMHVGVCFE